MLVEVSQSDQFLKEHLDRLFVVSQNELGIGHTEIDKKKVKSLLSRKNVIKEKEIIISTIVLTETGKKVIQKGIKVKDEISQITSSVIK